MSCKSSFDGNIDEIPKISVDNFYNNDRRAYFLSHYHSDHYCGLHAYEFYKYLMRNNVHIYTSKVTAAIIGENNSKLMKFVIGLNLGTNSITIKSNNNVDGNQQETNDHEEIFTVTLLPAGHCFGSVMFLFKINDKNILYTGDFRMSGNAVEKHTHFHTKNGEVISLDALYVDTTFQDRANFPTREEAVENLVVAMKKWLNTSERHCIALHTSAAYGYEFVYNEIFKSIHMKVLVDKRKWAVYCQFPEVLQGVTTDPEGTKIHLCMNKNEKQNHKNCCLPQNNTNVYLYIHFSAYKWYQYDIDEILLNEYERRIDVCFSTHNSRSELLHFINYLSPKRIVGFPNEYIKSPVKKDDDEFKITPKKRKVCFNVDKKLGRKVDSELLNDMFG